MTVRIPKWVVWVLGTLIVAVAIGAAFVIGRSGDGDGDTSVSSPQTSPTSSETTTTEAAAVPAKCSDKEAMRATERTGFSDAIIATGEVQADLAGYGDISGPGVDGPFFDEVSGYRPDILECRDLTGDDIEEMIFAPSAGASGTVLNWAIFTPDESGEWTLAFHREAVKVRDLRIRGDLVVETSPTYAEGEPLCCPSGKRATEINYEDGEFVVVSPVSTASERLIAVTSGGVEKLGKLRPDTLIPSEAYSAFGTPSSITRLGELCDYAWEDLGLEIHFANLGGADPCGVDGSVGTIDLLGSAAGQAGWHTSEGAHVGMTDAELMELYPGARTKRGELALIEKASPIGQGSLVSVLSAVIVDGEARAFRLYVGAAGE